MPRLDASQVGFCAGNVDHWLNDVEPGDTDDAIDQLAARINSIVSSGGHIPWNYDSPNLDKTYTEPFTVVSARTPIASNMDRFITIDAAGWSTGDWFIVGRRQEHSSLSYDNEVVVQLADPSHTFGRYSKTRRVRFHEDAVMFVYDGFGDFMIVSRGPRTILSPTTNPTITNQTSEFTFFSRTIEGKSIVPRGDELNVYSHITLSAGLFFTFIYRIRLGGTIMIQRTYNVFPPVSDLSLKIRASIYMTSANSTFTSCSLVRDILSETFSATVVDAGSGTGIVGYDFSGDRDIEITGQMSNTFLTNSARVEYANIELRK